MSKKLLEYLVKDPCDHEYSSARYYEMNEKIWFFEDLREEFKEVGS